MDAADYVAVWVLTWAQRVYERNSLEELTVSVTQVRGSIVELGSVPSNFPNELIVEALDRLAEADLAEPFATPHAAPRYVVPTSEADTALEVFDEGQGSVGRTCRFYRRLGQDWLVESIRGSIQGWEPGIARNEGGEVIDIPASDRVVSRSDNEPDIVEFEESLHELKTALQGCNELTEEEREAALLELAVIEFAVAQPRISIDLIQRFNTRVLSWLSNKFAEGVVALAVQNVLTAAARAFGLSL